MAGRPEGIVDDIASQVRPGSIVLAHDTGSDDRLVTIDRLRAIIGRLRDDGYTFATVSDLLASSTTSPFGTVGVVYRLVEADKHD